MRKLKAIEIAEGALLIDIALVLQVIALLLPIGGTFFYMLVCVVYAVLVLRRGLYTGLMSMAVTLFVASMISGPQIIFLVLLEGLAGLYLGITMRLRWHHLPLVVVGVFCGALAIYCLVVGVSWLLGVPLDATIRSMHHSYTALLELLGSGARSIGLGTWWQQWGLPRMNDLGTLLFTYWWIALYSMWCCVLVPLVICIYGATNMIVRLLGCDVRPLIGARTGGSARKVQRWLLRFSLRSPVLRKLWRRA